MSKRTMEEGDEVSGVSNEAKKPLLEIENVLSKPSNEESDVDELEEKSELELRDLLLENPSVTLNDKKFAQKVIKLQEDQAQLNLPEGWIALCHRSGGIVYLHRPTRVCSWGRPYHLGEGSVRKHDVPTMAIPCLHQMKATGNFGTLSGCLNDNKDVASDNAVDSKMIGNDACMNCDHLSNSNTNCHCCASKIIDTINISKSNDSMGILDGYHDSNLGNQDSGLADHKSEIGDGNPVDGGSNLDNQNGDPDGHHNNLDDDDGDTKNDSGNKVSTTGNLNCSTKDHQPSNLNKQSCFAKQTCKNQTEDDYKIDMFTCAEISEYLERLWEFRVLTYKEEKGAIIGQTQDENDNPSLATTIPYLIDGALANLKQKGEFVMNPVGKSPQSLLNEYCCKVLKVKPLYKIQESGDPKKAFLATVEIDGLQYGSGMASSKKQSRHIAAQRTLDIFVPGTFEKLFDIEQYLKLFDNVPIEDSIIYELTTKLGLMTPHQVLNECHRRNQGVLTSEIKFQMHQSEDKKVFCSIECGKYNATVPCQNKKRGRELAAQALLQKLHPHLENWGSILRIYIDKHTIQEYTKTKDTANETAPSDHGVNYEILSDLKHEMWKLLKKRKSQPSTSVSTKFTDIEI